MGEESTEESARRTFFESEIRRGNILITPSLVLRVEN